MPTPADDDRYIKSLISTVTDLSQQLGTIRAEIKEDVAQLLRSYREDNHRAIMGVHIRIVSLEDTIETDRASRVARQQLLDGELRGIRNNQRVWIRVVMFAALIAVGVAIGIWVL